MIGNWIASMSVKGYRIRQKIVGKGGKHIDIMYIAKKEDDIKKITARRTLEGSEIL